MAEKLVIKNVGLLLSGDLTQPILDANTVVVVDGRIAAVGKEQDLDHDHADIVVDAKGTALAPGLIDSHVHPVCGGSFDRQKFLNGQGRGVDELAASLDNHGMNLILLRGVICLLTTRDLISVRG